MKKIVSVTVAAAVLFTLAACSTPSRPEDSAKNPARSSVQSVEIPEQQLRELATGYAKEVLGGLENGDYPRFIRNYAAEYAETMTAAKFAPMTKMFQKRNGKLEQLDYLGTLNQGAFKMVVWKARFARTRALEEALKRDGRDPAAQTVPDVLVRLLLGNVDGQWKIFAIVLN